MCLEQEVGGLPASAVNNVKPVSVGRVIGTSATKARGALPTLQTDAIRRKLRTVEVLRCRER